MSNTSNSEFTVELLQDIDGPRAKEAVAVLVDAFENDVIANNQVGGHVHLRQMMFETIVRATQIKGLFYVAVENSTGKIVGTSCWFPKGVDGFADEDQRERARLPEFFSALGEQEPDVLQWWLTTFMPTLSGLANKFLKDYVEPGQDVRLQNWTLYSLSVKRSYQGRGISKKLAQVGEEQAFSQGLITLLETDSEKNLGIYEKLGYKIAGYERVEGPPTGSDYNFYVLFKKADV